MKYLSSTTVILILNVPFQRLEAFFYPYLDGINLIW